MCTYSMIVDHYRDKWWPGYPNPVPPQWTPWKNPDPWPPQTLPIPKPDPEELKRQVEEFKKLLERARKYDKDNKEPDCDLEIKKKALRELAKLWDIDISFIDEKE